MKRSVPVFVIVTILGMVVLVSLWTTKPLAASNGQLFARINFQPAEAIIPPGYEPDSGDVFGERGNGLAYGWGTYNSENAWERNLVPNQEADTLIYMQALSNPDAFWEISVPNGVYSILVAAGDPAYIDSVYRINVEDTLAMNAVPTVSRPIIKKTVTVTVTDGRLTISNAPNAINNKLAFVHIYQIENFNHPPIAVDDTFGEAGGNVLANDSDQDGDALTAVLQTSTQNGVLILNADGTFIYTPDPGFEGTDTFTYVAHDGWLNSNIATVAIEVVLPRTIVPDVVGLTEAEANDDILTASLTVGITTTEHSNIIPVGHVISQSPVAGEEVSLGTAVDLVISLGPLGVCQVYTTNADFDLGTAINVGHPVPDQLQLNDDVETFNFIWVAVSSKGTVVKIDTETGQVLGEYYTSPAGQPRNPSRTTVDLNGNVWTANRDGNSVVHIGLQENGQCVDRNSNGVIDTSTGLNNILAWTNAGGADTNGGVSTAADECILHYTRVSASGTRHVSVNSDNDVWVSGWVSGSSNHPFNLIDGETGQIIRTEPSVGYGGYGGLIDGQGVIWSASPLLRWNTDLPLTGPNGGNWRGYSHPSYGLCIDSQGNVWNTAIEGNAIRKFAPNGTLLGTFGHGEYYAQGCTVDGNDDVWVANSLYRSTVGHLKNNGTFVGNVTVGSGPTGVAVDSAGKIWATNYNDGTVSRIDPNAGPIGADGVTRIGAVDFTTPYLGGNLYNYSDMTGSTLTGAPDEGTWTAVFDSELENASWGAVGWFADLFGDGAFSVAVATSNDGITFSPPVTVVNGEDLTVPDGRYLQITASFNRASTGESPILYDISACTLGLPLPPINHPPVAVDDAFGADGGNALNNDTDPDEDTLTAVLHTPPLHGTVTLNTDGTFTYIPEPGFEGTDTFTYVANDGQLDSNVATVSIEVVLPRTIVPDVVGLAEAEAEADIIAASLTVGVTTTAHSETIPAGHVISQNPAAGEEVLLGTAVDLVISLGPAPRPDLIVSTVDASQVSVNGQTLVMSGTVTTTLSNPDEGDVVGPIETFLFEDRNHNGTFEDGEDNQLGSISATDLASGETMTVSVPVVGELLFAGNLIYAYVDALNTIVESDETNNYNNSGAICQPPEPGVFSPVLEWEWTQSPILPTSRQVMMTPAIIDITDDGIPDIIFTTFSGSDHLSNSHLRAISGDGSGEIFAVTNSSYDVRGSGSLAVGDIDLDGLPEILAVDESGSRLIAFEHDGTYKWRSSNILGGVSYGGASLADLDANGIPEVIVGSTVLNNDGSTRWIGDEGRGNNYSGPLSLVADLNMDGSPEIVAGRTTYHADGSIYWNVALGDGFNAVGNFDDDPYPEIVLISTRQLYLLEHNGDIKWGPVLLPGSSSNNRGGAPTIADVDNDGEPEIGIAGGYYYSVFEANGSLKWSSPTQDLSSNQTGSSVFDFEGDGSVEIVYSDELQLRIYRGTDGAILWSTPSPSNTTYEMPLIADVDVDGNAEIVMVSNNYVFPGSSGIQVYGDINDNWVATRQIWNQHTYHITNVNNDGTIPANEVNNWEVYNNYRLNTYTEGPCASVQPDLTASFARLAENPDGGHTVTVRIGNGGGIFAPAGVFVAFYDADPHSGGNLLGTTTTTGQLDPGHYEDVNFTLSADTVVQPLWVVADDIGGLNGVHSEPNELNNFHNTGFTITPIFIVPDVVGLAQADAEADIVAANLVVGMTTTANSGTVPAGHVISQTPTAGTSVAIGTEVDLVISLGSHPDCGPMTTEFIQVNPEPGIFIDSGQNIGMEMSAGVALGDIDEDGDLDAFVVNVGADRVWLNDGHGVFTDSGQCLGVEDGAYVALGDLDSDGDLDAYVVNQSLQPTDSAAYVWLNDGTGLFSDSGQRLGSLYGVSVALGDVDNDSDLDAFVTNFYNQPAQVWLNNGHGFFTNSGQNLGATDGQDVSLGDIDADGDLDAVAGNWSNMINRIWVNDGAGHFTSGQALGSSSTGEVELGDLDGDDDLDIFFANWNQPSRVWFNNGTGTFNDSGQTLDTGASQGAALGDIDQDGDLDVFIGNNQNQPEQVWLNNGQGTFSNSGQMLGSHTTPAVALGDLDGDGDLDAFAANGDSPYYVFEPNKVYINQGLVAVPDVVGLAQTEAEADITAANLMVGAVTTAHSDTVLVGHVISQDPVGDTSVASGTAVDLVISLGPVTMILVPDVVGLAQADAEAAVLAASLTVGNVTTAQSDTVPIGHVISQAPAGGSSVAAGTAVDLVISLGAATATVPDVVGLPQADAEADIGAAGLIVGTVTTAHSNTVPVGHVISQNPAGGTNVAAGTAVDLVISLGPALPNPPQAQSQSVTTNEDVPLTIALQATDVDSPNLTFALVSGPGWGSLGVVSAPTCTGNGGGTTCTATVTYTPAANEYGYDSFTFLAHDGLTASAPALVEVTVNPVNDAPIAVGYGFDMPEDNYLVVPPPGLFNLVYDLENDPLTVAAVDQPIHGVLELDATGAFTYTPQLNFNGVDSFTFVANDGLQNSLPATFLITVTAVADAPVAVNDAYSVAANSSLTVPAPGVLGNDSDGDGDPLTAVLVSNPLHGTLTLNADGSFTYTPNSGYSGADNFSYRASDGGLNSNSATVAITVIPPGNQPPTAVPDAYNVTADQTLTVAAPGVLGNDSDPNGNPLTAVLVSTVSHGTLALNANGSFSYTPSAGYTGSDNFTYHAHDGSLNSNDAIVTITVNPPAGPPPVVDITAPGSGATVTSPTDLIGTADSAALAEWQWAVRPLGGTDWLTFLTGTTPVVNGPFGQFDPTLLLNGRYHLRLTAIDTAGQFASETIEILVKGDMKVGIFTLSFVDLEIPVAGLPIQVIRTYDSRDKRVGDFGVGWRMDLRNVQAEENSVPGLDWEGVRYDHLLFDEYCIYPATPHLVTVTLPDSTVYEFSATVTPQCQLVLPQDQVTVSFTPRPGTNTTLSIAGNNQAFVFGDFEASPNPPGDIELWDPDDLIPFNPSQYRLTLSDGRILLLDEVDGMVQITDLNGNQLNISDTGITHSAGPDIEFVRDGQGRITQIIDPAGQTVSYDYDANGDLVLVTDQAGYTTTMAYEDDHYLVDITDSRGIQAVRNEYDENGRLTAHVDANGQRIEYTHDIDGRQELITDRLGHVTLYVYDDRGNVLAQTDSLGNTTTYTYDSRDNMLTETDALGNTTSYTYDSRDNLLSQIDPLGHTTSYTYNSLNLVLTITDPLGNVTTNSYDGDGNLLTTTDPMGHTTSYTYDSRGLQTSMTDPVGNVNTYVYDSVGNLLREVNALGYATVYTYDTIGNRLSQTVTRTVGSTVETLVTSYVYDARGRLTRTTYPDGSQTRTIYGSLDQPGITIDPLGRETHYSYDALGRLVSTTYPDGTTESQTYDAEARRLTSTDRGGRVTTFVYDNNGRLTSTIALDGATMTTVYDDNGRISQVIDPRGNSTTYSYDAAGRQTAVTDALGHVTTFLYDANGNQTSMTDVNGHTTGYEYDDNGRRARIIYADGTDSVTTYDALGRSITQTDQAGLTTQFSYDALGQLTAVTDALGQVTSYGYDEVGNHLTQTDANGHTTTFAYDNMGRRTVRILPLGMLETTAYDLAGNLLSKTDFNGRTTTYIYDAMNRLTSKTPDPVFSQPPVSYTYTASGQRASMTDSTGTTLYLYDNRERLITKTTPFGSLFYSYDLAGNLLSIDSSNANGVSVDYTYDALNRLATATDNRLVNGVTSYSYDDVGNLARYLYPNGVQTSYSYNDLNRLTDMSVANSTTTLASYAYNLGAAGNRLSVAELGGRTVSYGYDNLYRLTSETIAGDIHGNNGAIGYVYDPVGNRLERNSTVATIPTTFYGYDANDRLTSDMYDANGNTTLSEGNGYIYDFENRLVNLNGGEVTMQYDGDGNRVAKTVAGVTTHYLVDDRNLTGFAQVMEEIVGTAVLRQYTYGLDLISQNQLISNTWNVSFYGYDGHGSVRFLSNEPGILIDIYDHDAFGSLLHVTGTTSNYYLYSGEQFDPSITFYYLRARYYNQNSGRFVSQDPFEGIINDPPSLHRYLFVHGNPIANIDPSGKSTIGIGLANGTIDQLLVYQKSLSNLTALSNILSRRMSGGSPCPRYGVQAQYITVLPISTSSIDYALVGMVRGPEAKPGERCHVNVQIAFNAQINGRQTPYNATWTNVHIAYDHSTKFYELFDTAGLVSPLQTRFLIRAAHHASFEASLLYSATTNENFFLVYGAFFFPNSFSRIAQLPKLEQFGRP